MSGCAQAVSTPDSGTGSTSRVISPAAAISRRLSYAAADSASPARPPIPLPKIWTGAPRDPDLAQYLVTIGLRGPIGVLELADLLGQNHPKASRSLARLEQLGLVQRGAADHDRRIKTAALTPEGNRVVQAINQGRRRLLEEAFAGWSEHDQAELARLTRRLSDAMFALMEVHDRAT